MNTSEPSRVRRLAETVPVTYMIFDLMHLDGHSRTRHPLRASAAACSRAWSWRGRSWATPAAESGGGAAVLEAAQDAGLEGVVAKRLDSPYRPGSATRAGAKVKNFRTQSVVIGGWAAGQGHLEGDLGALLARGPERPAASPTSAGSAPVSMPLERVRAASRHGRPRARGAPLSLAPFRARRRPG